MSGDPLQLGSGATTPDSATDWDAVDREIERLSASSSFVAVKKREPAPPHHPLDSEEEDELEQGEDGLLEREAAAYDGTALHERLARRRVVLLGCAAVLSVGSHYSTYTLGPIKKSLGTSEGGFAALVSSFEVLNTVSPLLSGFLVPRYGAAACGLVATGAVLVGQLVVCFAAGEEGGVGKNVGVTVLGLLLFGSGTSPLAVVQESIILKHNSASSKFVARSVAAGLVLGKSASFAAGWSSQRLYAISPRLPFLTAASLAAFSFAACVLYATVERSTSRLVAQLTVHENTPRAKADHLDPHPPALHLSSLASFGTPFWWYIAVCVLAGTWYTTQHLATHLLQATYGASGLPQQEASSAASVPLGAPIVIMQLYPLVGWIVDMRPHLLSTFWLLVPSLTATTFFLLLLLSPAVPPLLALLPAAIGMGSGPLLLVLVVPRIVERQQAPTALGAHKSLEMAGAILSQTLSAALLSLGAPPSTTTSASPSTAHPLASADDDDAPGSADLALLGLLVAALVQLALVARWWHAIRVRDGEAGRDGRRAGEREGEGGRGGGGAARDEAEMGLLAAGSESEGDEGGLLSAEEAQAGERPGQGELLGRRERLELRRGTRALRAAAGTVVASWACFVWDVVRG
ncbi:hypothetical protein JCM9279_001190 [Rhodotorula babjevae]